MNKTTDGERRWPFVLILVITFMVTIGVSYFYFVNKFSFESSFLTDIVASHTRDIHSDEKNDPGRLYESGGQDTAVQDSEIARQDTLLVSAENIIKKELEPYKVRLLDLYVDKQGIIYIDMSGEIRNFKGDAFEELSLIAGLYKGLKSALPDFASLKILIEGSEADTLGGHIDISKPIGEEIVESLQ